MQNKDISWERKRKAALSRLATQIILVVIAVIILAFLLYLGLAGPLE